MSETAASLEFGVLGALVMRAGGGVLAAGPPKQRALTSLLLMRPSGVVPFHEMIEELWGPAPPRSAAANLRTYAGRLRAALPPRERDRLVARPLGYRLRVEDGELDLDVFEAEAAAGRASLEDGRAEEALRRLETGLALWRGEMLEDVPHGPVIAARKVAVDALRLSAEEDRCEALLALDQPARALDPLRALVTAHPLRERAWGLLMRTLYALHDVCGALDAYAEARGALAEDLGIEPHEELRRLHQAILRRELAPLRTVVSAPGPACPPRQLPPSTAVVGREEELSDLTRRLGAPGDVVIVHGPAGSGKSCVAVSAAHAVADRYPDGQLYVDLRAAGPGADALCQALRGLGAEVTGPDVAHLTYRSVLADRRMLVMLDNAADTAQVRPFLVASPGSTVLVTSCPMLSVLDGAAHLRVGPLGHAASLRLLSLHVGPARLRREPDAADDLVRLCGRLPLALRIAAARLRAHADRPVRELADRLGDERQRLDELEADDLALRASLRSPYDCLAGSGRCVDRLAAEVFRRLGPAPAGMISVQDAVRAVRGRAGEVVRALDRLVEMELAGFRPPDRYVFADLARLLARDVAAHLAERGLNGGSRARPVA
ncbi:AfsR/SARP family transcriptional regulator [Planobispora rosea]|uniref:AfsR/SARP family transcriptional regulator n=1 Tax=Planobispora rosea TaxID=35762 RepID=UPI00166FB2E6|nr:AfsR/SARP family transcriptional regulator [Planobispora rosea]